MYSPAAGSGYGYSSQAPVVPMDRLNISATDPPHTRDLHNRSAGLTTADYSRADNGYMPGSYGYGAFSVLLTRLALEQLQIDTDLLPIITCTADELSRVTNVDDLERL